MKITTATPSQLAQSTDVTDRDITSNLEILQEAIFPLEAVPDILRVPQNAAPPEQRSSFGLSARATVTNAGANIFLNPALGKGLWRITIFVHYVSNFASSGTQGFAFVHIPLNGAGGQINVIEFEPVVGQITQRFDYKFLVNDDDTSLQALLAANAAGQTHSAHVSLICEKYF